MPLYPLLQFFRQASRRNGFPAQNSIERFLDKNFDDERLESVFPNMQLVTDDGAESIWGPKDIAYRTFF